MKTINNLPRKKKKKAKKKVALAIKKMIPLFANVVYELVVLTHQVNNARLAMKMFMDSIHFYHVHEPITRCDRLIEFKR